MIAHTLKIMVLPVLTALTLAIIYFAPRTGTVAQPSVSMDLPIGEQLSGWLGVARQESEKERRLLADDTEFSKADYYTQTAILMPDPGQKRLVTTHVSLVKSGSDLNNSIHRPERCLPSQGHFNLKSEVVELDIPGHEPVKLTKLKSQQNITPNQTKSTILDNMHYYVFIGHKHITESHLTRTLLDMKDRILFGIDQRWVYFQISTPYGDLVGVPEETAKKHTEQLIRELLARLVKWDELAD